MDKKLKGFLDSLKSKGLTNNQIKGLAQKQKTPEAWNIDLKQYMKNNKERAQKKQAQGAANLYSGDAVRRRLTEKRVANKKKDNNSFGNSGFAGSVGRAIISPFKSRGPSPEQKAAAKRRLAAKK